MYPLLMALWPDGVRRIFEGSWGTLDLRLHPIRALQPLLHGMWTMVVGSLGFLVVPELLGM